MLRFAEEIMLLLLDDESGEFAHIPEWSLRYALAGAVLMDIALENRIDTDPKRLTLLDPTPIGDDLLDPTLESIAQSTEVHDICHWIEHTAENAYSVRDKGDEAPYHARHFGESGRSLPLGVSVAGVTR